MKKLPAVIIVLALMGCGNNNEWSREKLINKCKFSIKDQEGGPGTLTPDNITRICECDADKLMKQYKSKAEADKDLPGVNKIYTDCTSDALTGK